MKVHSLQLQALSVLSEVAHEVTPTDEPMQGADSHEWLSPIVYSLSRIVSTLDNYLRDYAYVTPSEVLPLVRDAISIANTHKWGVIEADDPEYEPSSLEIDGVVKLGNTLGKAVEHFKKDLGI